MVDVLYNDDCLNILPTLESGSVDLVVTDCPYKIIPGGCTGRFRPYHVDGFRTGKLFEHNELVFSQWLPEVYRVLKAGTHCYVMINGRNLKDLQVAAENAGFVFQNLLVWDKVSKVSNWFYMLQTEFILMLAKYPARRINHQNTPNLLHVNNIIGKQLHPTEKPVALMEILIDNSSTAGDIVLDPFMGVGSTILAAKLLGRKYIGIEIEKGFFDNAEARIKACPKPLW